MPLPDFNFQNEVVVITGGGNDTGRNYGLLLSSRGASIIINDVNKQGADEVVESIKAAKGEASANYNSLFNGDKIIDYAMERYGAVQVLINIPPNSGIAYKKFLNVTDQDWDAVQKDYIYGAYKTARAAWPRFKKQKYGRIVNISSTSGSLGNHGHASHIAAEYALIGFTETLAKEGAKNNIVSNLIISTPSHLNLTVPLAAVLASKSVAVNGSVFDVNNNSVGNLRWERTKPLGFKTDASLTPSAVLKKWSETGKFSQNDASSEGPWDAMDLLHQSQLLPPNPQGEVVDFSGKVAIVTGAGNGLGRQYALLLSRLGARVVVNDLDNPQSTVDRILARGGQAVSDKHSVENGDKIVETALKHFGELHILINNAGILRDVAFQNMSDDLWNIIQSVHLRGSYKTLKAAWPIFVKQKYGRIVNTTSVSGIYGNFGQSNYAAAKCGTIGLSASLAVEGAMHNIRVNTIGPSAGTQLTRTVMPEEIVQALKPDYVAPFVLALLSDNLSNSVTGGLYEIGSGFIATDRLQRHDIHTFSSNSNLTPEQLASAWPKIASVVTSKRTGNALGRTQPIKNSYLEKIEQWKNSKVDGKRYTYTTNDLILYNLGLQANASELKWVYEGSPYFEVLPTFGVIPYFDPSIATKMNYALPNFSEERVLHGEQYLEIRKFPIPTSGTLLTYPSLVEVLDKGKAAVVINSYRSVLESTGEDVFYIEETTFIRGSGNFGGSKQGHERGAATAANTPPARKPDVTVIEKTSPDAAALYRLSGDLNPLHVDPEVAKAGGLQVPILHGLCSFGISAKHVYSSFGPFRNIKVRFNSMVIPGQTLKTEMWRQGKTVVFQTTVVETQKVALAAAAVELFKDTASL